MVKKKKKAANHQHSKVNKEAAMSKHAVFKHSQ